MAHLAAVHTRDDQTGALTSCSVFDSSGVEHELKLTPLPAAGGDLFIERVRNHKFAESISSLRLTPASTRALRDYLIEICDQLPSTLSPESWPR